MPSAGPRKDLGTKHECHECGAKYYDLHRPVPTCPKCGADPRETPTASSRPAAAALRRPPMESRPPPKRIANDEVDEDEDEDDDDDKAVEVMADPSFTPSKFRGGANDKDNSTIGDDGEDEDKNEESDFESEEMS